MTPQHTPLFEDLARYTCNLLARNANTSLPPAPASDGPAAKKRKLQNGDTTNGATAQAPVDLKGNASIQFYVQDISFAAPQRKKLTLEITAGSRCLRARNQTTKEVEFGVPMDQIREYAIGIDMSIVTNTAGPYEAMVFTVADGPAKAAFLGTGQQVGHNPGETAEALIRKVLNDNMAQTNVICPDERQFVSAMPEPHRKKEKAYHVKAFRGSKEGYLFLLSTGILFAFKKPLLFFSFDTIDSVSYTSVLQRTFNLNIMARPANGSEEDVQELEFSMIDQADYGGIDDYIKRHGLQDASLAEARRAKVYNINGGKAEDPEAAAMKTEGDEESELQKAQRELEDQEDEEEEDYDPGSDGESEGSGGSSSEEDEDGDEFHEDAEQVSDGDDEDLLKEEGSDDPDE
ncbi:hypothetical protein N7510_002257 [Penicillium lagena]|uniref:uncharacterized protein n=1 Tax=Penicillium lagena TaxID=94218 RepID=UPI002541AA93|nr:uncharacterized protein N7510_002257 [Penicillium lagena]KAJ5625948.1 hypothetical protein N7510_002257 [Penicillium lagena]